MCFRWCRRERQYPILYWRSEANETDYWLSLLKDTDYMDDTLYKSMADDCQELRKMLIASVKTAKQNKI